MNVAIVGGARFDSEKLERFMLALARKHPRAVIVSGNGKGSEQEAVSQARRLGFVVQQPEIHEDWYGKEALMIQVNDILIQAGYQAVVVLVGTGARPTRAREIVERVDKYMEKPRLIHEVARLPVKEREPAPRRAKKQIFD
jgi:predicted TIM-barrel enzyme